MSYQSPLSPEYGDSPERRQPAADLHAPAAPRARLTIRPFAEADQAAAQGILRAAYTDHPVNPHSLRRIRALQPDGLLLAELDGAPAGLAGAVDYGPFAYIGMMAVHPGHQRRGVGQALVERLLAWLEQRGCPMAVLDASDAGEPLYRRLGFVTDDKTYLFVNDDCARRAALPERVRPIEAADLPALAALDAPLFGAARPAALELIWREQAGRGFLAQGADGQPEGFLIAQEQLLGPWVARTPAAAEALLAAALTLPFDGSPRAQLSTGNGDATRILLRAGFSPLFGLSHMRYGGAPRGRSQIYGQTSFSLG